MMAAGSGYFVSGSDSIEAASTKEGRAQILEEMDLNDPFELSGLYEGTPLTEKSVIDDCKWVAETFMGQRIPVALCISKGVVKGLHP